MYKHPPLDLLHMADVVEDTTAIANIMGAFTFLNCYKQHKRQFENWSHNEPTLTLNGGKYVGYEAVKEFFVDYNEAQTRWANETMRKLFPEELGGKSDEEIWAVGSNTVLTMTTPIIEVAFDGRQGHVVRLRRDHGGLLQGPQGRMELRQVRRGLHQGGRRVEDLALLRGYRLQLLRRHQV